MSLNPETSKTLLKAARLLTILAFIGLAFGLPKSTIGSGGKVGRTVPASLTNDLADQDDEIKGMIAKYAQSIDEADTTLASQIWSDSTEVSFIHPLGHEHNLEQIKQSVYRHLMGDTFSERKLSVHDISTHTYGDAAWAEFYWDFTAKLRKDGTAITTHGRETQIYRKEQSGWRLVHVHYSAMPVADERKGL